MNGLDRVGRHVGRVAQLVRALVSHTRGPGFESLRDHTHSLEQTAAASGIRRRPRAFRIDARRRAQNLNVDPDECVPDNSSGRATLPIAFAWPCISECTRMRPGSPPRRRRCSTGGFGATTLGSNGDPAEARSGSRSACVTLLSVEHHAGWHVVRVVQLADRGITERRLPLAARARPSASRRRSGSLSCSRRTTCEPARRSTELARLRARGWHVSERVRARGLPKLRSGALLIVDNVNWFLPRQPGAGLTRPGGFPLSPTWERFETPVSGGNGLDGKRRGGYRDLGGHRETGRATALVGGARVPHAWERQGARYGLEAQAGHRGLLSRQFVQALRTRRRSRPRGPSLTPSNQPSLRALRDARGLSVNLGAGFHHATGWSRSTSWSTRRPAYAGMCAGVSRSTRRASPHPLRALFRASAFPR